MRCCALSGLDYQLCFSLSLSFSISNYDCIGHLSRCLYDHCPRKLWKRLLLLPWGIQFLISCFCRASTLRTTVESERANEIVATYNTSSCEFPPVIVLASTTLWGARYAFKVPRNRTLILLV
jgi:hypothetical protein